MSMNRSVRARPWRRCGRPGGALAVAVSILASVGCGEQPTDGGAAEPAVDEAAIAEAIAAMATDETLEQVVAARPLRKAGDAALPAMLDALDDDDARVRAGIVLTLESIVETWAQATQGRLEDTPANPLPGDLAGRFVAQLKSDRVDVRRAMAKVIGRHHFAGRLPPALTVPALTRNLIEDSDAQARSLAAHAMRKMESEAEAAIPRLIEALGSARPDVRYHAADLLGRREAAASSAVPALLGTLARPPASWERAPACRDEWLDDRAAAAWALGLIGSEAESVVPKLVAALEDGDDGLRFAAVVSLARFGPAARSAEPAVREALDDSSRWVRQQASVALERILELPPAGKYALGARTASTGD